MSSAKEELREAYAKVKLADHVYYSADDKYQYARNAYIRTVIESENVTASAEKADALFEAWKRAHIDLAQADEERIRAETALSALINSLSRRSG